MTRFNINQLTQNQKKLRKRILEISYKNSFSHIGSCFTAVDLIDSVYHAKRHKDIFILSNGHAAVALYAVLEKYGEIKNKDISENLFVHPDRNTELGIHVSTGSLGQGLPIAVGMALAQRKRNVYCMISDGESTEGSIWEALHIAVEQKLFNLTVLVNANGWGAYGKTQLATLHAQLKGFGTKVFVTSGHDQLEIEKALKKSSRGIKVIFAKTISNQLPFLHNLDAHYYIMTEIDYIKAKELLV